MPDGAELVLQPAEAQRICRAVFQGQRHEIEAEASRSRARTLGPRGRQREAAIGIAGEPFEAGQAMVIALPPRHRRRGADIAAAMLLGGPGAAGEGRTIPPRQQRQIALPHRRRAVAREDIGDGPGHGDGAMQRDIRLGEQIAHGEGQQEGGGRLAIVEPDDTAAIGLARDRLPAGVLADAIGQAAIGRIGLQDRARMAVGIGGGRIHLAGDPGAEARERGAPRLEAGPEGPRQRALQIDVGIEEVGGGLHGDHPQPMIVMPEYERKNPAEAGFFPQREAPRSGFREPIRPTPEACSWAGRRSWSPRPVRP